MMSRNAAEKRKQLQIVCIDDLVPQDDILRKIDEAMDWGFIYDIVEDKYCADNGRPSIDPVVLIKIAMIQCLFGIKSMRQTIKEINVNASYRWFLGYDFTDPVPHFSTFGKNYSRRFAGTGLFEEIFKKVLEECMRQGFVDTELIFVDSTHVKARANRNKKFERAAEEKAAWYAEELEEEIEKDREAHGKKPLKEKDGGGTGAEADGEEKGKGKTQKASLTDPESGWFHKGEHKQVFAYSVQAACDRHGWVLGFSVHPGNEHDSSTFKALHDKIKPLDPAKVIADAGYKTPAIAKLLIDEGIEPIFPYKRPMTKEGFMVKREYVYDEGFDCYICPNLKTLEYSTTDRKGYKLYKSDPRDCAGCPLLERCTLSRNKTKVVARHVWEEYMETAEDIRHTIGNKEIYNLRKATIERDFGTAKEQHGFRYTQQYGKERMEMKASLTFACMNLKKLAKMTDLRKKNEEKSAMER